MTGDEILADRKQSVSSTDDQVKYAWERKVMACKQALLDSGLTPNSARVIITAARSFFSYHRTQLQFRRTETKRLGETHNAQEDYRFSTEDLRKLDDVGDLPEKYIIRVGKSLGLRPSDFLKLRRGDFEPYLSREAPIGIGPLNTGKESVKAYPFLDYDAVPIVKQMLEKLAREAKTSQSDQMLDYSSEIMLSRVVKRLVKKAGLATGDKRIRFHALRKFLIDRLASVMSTEKFKLIVGKVTSESAYVSVDSLRTDYAKVQELTCFTRNIDLDKRAKEIEELKKRLPEDVLKRMQELQMLRQKVKKNPEQCPPGSGKCQVIVKESELGQKLEEGFRYVATLPSGKLLLSNEA